jgi:CelD/BcsL family acetyltransferase involved in cellulose biosynthesis
MPEKLPTLRCRVVTDLPGIRALEPAWRALWALSRDPSTFTGYDWGYASAEAFSGTRSLCVLAVESGADVVGILPLSIEKGTVNFLGSPEADSNDIVCRPELEAEAVAAALETLVTLPIPWQRCTLDYVWEDSALLHALDLLPARLSSRLHLQYRGVAPRAVLPPDDPEAVSKIVKKKNEQKLERQLGRKGNLVFRFLEDPQDLRAGMESLVRLHAARRQEAGDSSVFLRPQIRAFYDALLPRLDPKTELRFFVMELDGRVVACQLAFECRNRLFCFKTGYDAEFRDHSPGTVMIRRFAQYASEHGVRVFDHSRGDEAYKARFSNATKRYSTLHVFRRGFAGWAGRSVLRFKARAKASAALARLLRKVGRGAPSVPAPKVEAGEGGTPG